jgi:hypothetical protein
LVRAIAVAVFKPAAPKKTRVEGAKGRRVQKQTLSLNLRGASCRTSRDNAQGCAAADLASEDQTA